MEVADRRGGVALAGLLVALLLWHTAEKFRTDLVPEMLWACHLATALAAVGLATGRPGWSVVGGLFHLVAGGPGYFLDVLLSGTTTPSSILLHLATPAAGLWAARNAGVPRWTWVASAGLFVASAALARVVTPPDLNVNLAFRPYDVWPSGTPVVVTWLATAAAVSAAVAVGEAVLAASFGRPR